VNPTPCAHETRIQEYLDGLLPAAEARDFAAHAAGCVRCATEMALYERVFATLADAPLLAPRAALTERVLDHVLPSRLRRHRRLVALGWGYAGAVAASIAALGVVSAQPAGRAALAALSGAASHRLMLTARFVLDTSTWLTVRAAEAWGLLSMTGQKLAPLSVGLKAVAAQPAIVMTVWAALAVTAGLLWWMRPRDRAGAKEVRHVGILAI
jgi:hypothetical protein